MLAEFASAVALVFSGAAAQPAIEIPALDERVRVREGATMSVLNRGVGRLDGQDVISLWGHRVTPVGLRNHGPFRYINRLRPGDEIVYLTPHGRTVYKVTGHAVIREARVWRYLNRTRADLVLAACHPPHSAAFRWIVLARRV